MSFHSYDDDDLEFEHGHENDRDDDFDTDHAEREDSHSHAYDYDDDDNDDHDAAHTDALHHTSDHSRDGTHDGTDGDDHLYDSSGDDRLDGGDGLDHAYFTAPLTQYSLQRTGEQIDVIEQNGSVREHDTLTALERVHFADRTIAFDIDGHAGEAYRLYAAALDRTPDERGLASWIKFMDDGGTLETMAQHFIDSDEFDARFGSLDNHEFVNQLYRNVLDRDGEAAGVTAWVDGLDHGLSRADVLTGFSESPENEANVASSVQGGISYVEWWLA